MVVNKLTVSMDWGQKLQSKFSTLSDSSSKESLQALAKWIGFNRKHGAAFCQTFVTAITTDTAHQARYLSCISLVCLLEHGNSKKWDRLNDLRIKLAETVILPTVPLLQEEGRKELASCLKEWDNANSFGGPTIINQIRKKLQQKQEVPKKEEQVKEASKEPDVVDITGDDDEKETSPEEIAEADLSPSTRRPSLTHMDSTRIDYDFEATGVPAKTVRPKEFNEPCMTIANLSILRDLRNDGALQLSSQLSSLPEDIRKVCARIGEGEKVDLDDATTHDFARRMNPALLDVDIQEQLNNIQEFRQIVGKTRMARKSLITMLQQSRCEFGADEAAEAFLGADGANAELRARQQILADAMELEGVEPPKLKAIETKELAPLTWYESDTKRQRTE